MERLEIIETLKRLPVRLEQETGGLSDATLRFRPAEGEYSIKETAGHLCDLAEVWHKRLNAICGLTDPRWPAFDGEASVRDHNYQDAEMPGLIDTIREWRLQTIAVLDHTVDWSRLGQHPELGRRSLKQWAEFVIAHDEDHLAVIQALKKAQTTTPSA